MKKTTEIKEKNHTKKTPKKQRQQERALKLPQLKSEYFKSEQLRLLLAKLVIKDLFITTQDLRKVADFKVSVNIIVAIKKTITFFLFDKTVL